MDVLNDEKESKISQPQNDDLDNPYALECFFDDPNCLFMENKHVTITPPITQTHPKTWIEIH